MWNERYAEAGFAYGEAPNDFLAEAAPEIPKGPVLCLAEGEGRNAVFLAQRGHAVVAVDQSSVGLEKARKLASDRGVEIETQVADLADYAIEPNSYAGIVSIWAHTPPALRRALHRKCVDGLQPGGVMLLEAYTPEQLSLGTGGPPNPAVCMTADALREELAGLEFTTLVERQREVAEGKYHNGLSAVVQLIARKPE